MSINLANRTQALAPSETLAINAQAQTLQKQGHAVLNLSAGEPDFKPPQALITAVQKAAQDYFHYTPVPGIPELKSLIAAKLKKENHCNVTANQIVISTGAKQALFNLLMVLCDPGDEVIVPTPAWVSYKSMIELAGGIMIPADTLKTEFVITAEQIAQKITKKTKAVIVTSPHNPTGSVIPRRELVKIGQLALDHDFYLICDEVYEHFIYENIQHFSLASIKKFQPFVCTVNSFSKSLGITGWRLGYCCGPETVMAKVGQLQSHSTSNANCIVQYGLATYLAKAKTEKFFKKNADTYQKRRDLVCQEIATIPGCSLITKPLGAFYVFMKIEMASMSKFQNSTEFSAALLKEEHVAVVPGSAFGQQYAQYVRISYTLSDMALREAFKRIRHFCKKNLKVENAN